MLPCSARTKAMATFATGTYNSVPPTLKIPRDVGSKWHCALMSSQSNVVHLSSQWERLQWALLKPSLKKPVSLKQEYWLGQRTFDRVQNFLNSLWLIAVWSAAWCDLQHVIRTILCEELQGGDESQHRGLWRMRLEGGLPMGTCL